MEVVGCGAMVGGLVISGEGERQHGIFRELSSFLISVPRFCGGGTDVTEVDLE